MSEPQELRFFEQHPEEQKHENIMNSIQQQEQNILRLLNKYKDLLPDPAILQSPNQNAQKSIPKLPTIKETNASKKPSKDTINRKSTNSDIISKTDRTQQQDKNKKEEVVNERMEVKNRKIKSSIRGIKNQEKLNKIRQDKFLKATISHPLKKVENLKKLKEEHKIREQKGKQNQLEEELQDKHQEWQEKEIMKPIAYKKEQVIESEDDEEGEVAVKFYQRQWATMYEQQCKEVMNFLYFSTTAEIQEWSQQIIEIFKRQDTVLEGLHKKNKFLQHFDENYFMSQVYRK